MCILLYEQRLPIFPFPFDSCLDGILFFIKVSEEVVLTSQDNLGTPLLPFLFIRHPAYFRSVVGVDGLGRSRHAKHGFHFQPVGILVFFLAVLWSRGAPAGIRMVGNFVSREDHLFPTVASAEVINVVPSFMAIPTSADILLLDGHYARTVGLELLVHHFHLGGETETVSAHPFRE